MSSSRRNMLGGRRPKILVTDDEASVRRSLQLMLHANGYDARSYTTASALLADAEARSADCVIADYSMPDIDGLSLLRKLRSSGWNRPAILVTAYASDELTRRAKACGFTDVVAKPFIRRPILEALHRYCECAGPDHCTDDDDRAPGCEC